MPEIRWKVYRRNNKREQVGVCVRGLDLREALEYTKFMLRDENFIDGSEVVIEKIKSEGILSLDELNHWLKKRNVSEG